MAPRTITRLVEALPEPLVRPLLSFRDRRRLAGLDRLHFETNALRQVTADDVAVLLGDPELATRWAEDQARIAATFGGENRGDAINPGDRRALYHLVAAFRPEQCLEIGTNIGGASITIAAALAAYGSPSATLTTLDIIDVNDPVAAREFRLVQERTPAEHLARLGLSARVEFVTRPALDYLGDPTRRFDLVFVDGDHTAHAVYSEMAAVLGALAPQGVVVLHDYYPDGVAPPGLGPVIPGPYTALERIRREAPGIVVRPLEHLPWETKLGSTFTSLALVTRE